MAARTTFRTTLRWAFFPVVVIAALNIENRAARAGWSDISLPEIIGSFRMTQLYQELTSDAALYVVLFLGGGCTFAWISYLLEKADQKWDSWALHYLSLDCENVAKAIEMPYLTWNMPRVLERLNARLVRFGFEPLPIAFDRREKARNQRSARYLRTIGPMMDKDLELAQRLGQAALNLEKERAVARRSPPDTGPGTLP